jgi:NAD(P)-dependent dehydrogenase (short-subunit alcohol dehydrogenase family)
MVPPLMRTAQGFELQFGVNHLGCFALTSLLLPKLAQNAGARVVVTASIAHKTGKLNWDDLNSRKNYGRTQRYSDSKLANLMFMIELDRRLRASGLPVSAMGCHPGVAATDLMRHLGPLQFAAPLMGLVLNSAEMGAWPALQAATDPSAQSGDYFGSQGWREMRGASGAAHKSKMAQNAELARRLWDISVELTGIDPQLPPA